MNPTPEQITHIINAIARYPADIDSSYPARVIEYWESIRPKDQAVPEPLAFPDPPYGWEWWNPGKLTPIQVDLTGGWRLACNGETMVGQYEYLSRGPDDGMEWNISGWSDATAGNANGQNNVNIRTKAPLPAPKPTPEEIERAEFEAWMGQAYPGADLTRSSTNPGSYLYSDAAIPWAVWKAAKKGAATNV